MKQILFQRLKVLGIFNKKNIQIYNIKKNKMNVLYKNMK